MSHYQTAVQLPCSVDIAFKAVAEELENWWGKQQRPILDSDTVFKVSWGEPWYQFEVIEFVKNQLMIWKCTDANQKIPGLNGVEKEWVGTTIRWEFISKDNTSSILKFEHHGLVPTILCFDFCSQSWNHFLNERLVAYVSPN